MLNKLQTALMEDSKKLQELPAAVQHSDVLETLLFRVEELDFEAVFSIDDGDRKPPQKHYVVEIVAEVLRIAERNNMGLCLQHDFVYLFNGQYWQAAGKQDIKTFLGRAAEKMGYSIRECQHYEFKDKLYKQFLSAGNLPVPKPHKERVHQFY